MGVTMTARTKYDTFTHSTHWNLEKREGDIYGFVDDRRSEVDFLLEGRRPWNLMTGKSADLFMDEKSKLEEWVKSLSPSVATLWTPDRIADEAIRKTFHAAITPFEVVERDGNILVTAGIDELIDLLIGGTAQEFDNSNAYIGVGDSSTAAAVGQTDLQAATNKLRKAMNGSYPAKTAPAVDFQSTFGSSEANFAWAEIATFNASSSGTMLNRVVQSLGTKASGATWTLTETITFS